MGPTEFAAEVERLKVEGRFPSLETLLAAIAETRAEFAPKILAATSGQKGERRPVVSKRLLYCVNVNRTSLDHLLLGKNADVDQMSNNPSISRDRRDVRRLESQPQPATSWSGATLGL